MPGEEVMPTQVCGTCIHWRPNIRCANFAVTADFDHGSGCNKREDHEDEHLLIAFDLIYGLRLKAGVFETEARETKERLSATARIIAERMHEDADKKAQQRGHSRPHAVVE